MAAVLNLLTERTFDFLGSTGDWTINGTHAMANSRALLKFVEVGAMLVTAGDSSDVVLTSPSKNVGVDYGWTSRAFVWVYSAQPVNVSITVASTLPAGADITTTSAVLANHWTLCSGLGPTPLQGAALTMTVSIDGLDATEIVYLTHPVLILLDAISRNLFAAEVWLRIPQFLQEADQAQTDPNYPLLRFIDVITSGSDEIYTLWDAYRYISSEDGGSATPTLLDPSVANLAVLRWWAQIVHVEFFNPSTGTTSWHSLETLLNPGGDPEWLYWESVPDTDDVGTDVQWQEIEDFASEPEGLLDLLRWQIQTAYFGIRGGTKEAIIETVKRVLTDTKTVEYTINFGGDPWTIRVRTLVAETPDVDTPGELSTTVQEMLARAIPVGFSVVHAAM